MGAAGAQTVNMDRLQEAPSARPNHVDLIKSPASNAQLERDTAELSDLCAVPPADMDDVKQGFMAKHVVEKLNRIEKLSNRVRQALTQEGGLNCNCFVPGTNPHHRRM